MSFPEIDQLRFEAEKRCDKITRAFVIVFIVGWTVGTFIGCAMFYTGVIQP